MSYTLKTATGRVQSGEVDHLWLPSRPSSSSKLGVVLMHGANTPDNYSGNTGWPSGMRLAAALANAGMPVCSPYEAIDTYGNDATMTRMTSAISALSSAAGCSAAKCVVVGMSMGGGAVTRFAALNPSKVGALVGVIPMASIIRLHQQTLGFTQAIAGATAWNTAYRKVTDGVTTAASPNVSSASAAFTAADVGRLLISPNVPYGTVINSQAGTTAVLSANATAAGTGQSFEIAAKLPTGTPSADLLALAPAIATAGVPSRFFYSTADQYITPSDVTALAAAAGGTAVAIDNTYGHADGTLNLVSSYNGGSEFSDLVNFLRAAGA